MAAIEADFPDATIDVARDDGCALAIVVTDVVPPRRVEVERSVTDLAWVVKQCAPWSVATR